MEKVKVRLNSKTEILGRDVAGCVSKIRKEVSSRTFVMGKYLADEGSANYSGDCGLVGDAVGGE